MSSAMKRECGGPNEEESELRRGPWTLEEDSLLIHYITRHGEGRWNMLAKSAGLKRTGKSCRLRWLNYLKPDIKRGNLTPHEQLLILELHSKWGNRWSKIAQHLPGRTDNEIKNYWRTRVQKQARQLNIESGSKRFFDAVRCFWVPTLLQKMEQNTSSTSYSSVSNMNLGNSAAEASMPNSRVPSLSPSPPPQRESIEASNHSSSISSSFSNFSFDQSSMKFSEMPEISEQPNNPFQLFEQNVYNNQIQDNWYMNTNGYGYGMEGVNLDNLSIMESYDTSPSQLECQTGESDWVFGMNDALWNMDAM
ncbi:hypothetical protein L6164_026852 [Bauhinia variegata]|uniref:Uncharacterized protein n=1 Tax=Bauhinia variegata TaxID=167791 RepID=A0ACB9LSY9_BAUVA|nr:hypothetical protein L6164_026852 [Bauhinia variegata]